MICSRNTYTSSWIPVKERKWEKNNNTASILMWNYSSSTGIMSQSECKNLHETSFLKISFKTRECKKYGLSPLKYALKIGLYPIQWRYRSFFFFYALCIMYIMLLLVHWLKYFLNFNLTRGPNADVSGYRI